LALRSYSCYPVPIVNDPPDLDADRHALESRAGLPCPDSPDGLHVWVRWQRGCLYCGIAYGVHRNIQWLNIINSDVFKL